MAGGPIFPRSAYPVTAAKVFPYIYIGAGANSKHEEVMGVMASVDADSTWRLRFQLPPSLPSGTGKLRLRALANATSGVSRVNPKWASVAVGEDASSATLQAEGTTPDARAGAAGTPAAGDTLVWGTGDADQYVEAVWNLNADTLVAGEEVVMDLVFETSSWTLAQVSGWIASIIWE